MTTVRSKEFIAALLHLLTGGAVRRPGNAVYGTHYEFIGGVLHIVNEENGNVCGETFDNEDRAATDWEIIK